jgi:hypothetical protein
MIFELHVMSLFVDLPEKGSLFYFKSQFIKNLLLEYKKQQQQEMSLIILSLSVHERARAAEVIKCRKGAAASTFLFDPISNPDLSSSFKSVPMLLLRFIKIFPLINPSFQLTHHGIISHCWLLLLLFTLAHNKSIH